MHRRPTALSPAIAALACLAAAQAQAQTAAATAELTRSSYITQIKAQAAYALGATGKGVTVAVLDTGLNNKHGEFAASGRLLTGSNFSGSGAATDTMDRQGHGSHVAGLIGASRNSIGMMGVAFEASLLPMKVLNDKGAGNTGMSDAALRAVVGRADIVNMSLGGSQAGNSSAMKYAIGKGLLIVAAAGNDGLANPGWPARFAKESWANNQIIAVGAVDARNVIASFSNRAGDTAAWFVVAPGVGLTSSYLGTSYASMSGTSMATPVVSGAAALIKSRWKTLRADQVANILFVTATDLGAPGIDAVYGRGLINVEKAMLPVGNVTTTSWNGRTIKVLDSKISPSPALGGIWTLAKNSGLKVIGFDDYQRDFQADLGANVIKPQALSLDQMLAEHSSRLQVTEQVLADGSRFTLALQLPEVQPAAAPLPFLGRGSQQKLAAFGYVSRAKDDGLEQAFGLGLASQYFGLAGTGTGEALRGISAMANPYLGLVPNAAYAGGSLPLAGGMRLKAGVLSSSLKPALQGQFGLLADSTRAEAAVLELQRQFTHTALSLSWSGTQERGAYLGSQSSGGLALAGQARTQAISFAAGWQLAPGWALGAQAAFGRTPGYLSADSLITGLSAQRTQSWSLGLAGANRWVEGDRLTLSLSQPMRAVSGQLQMNVVSGLDEFGMQQRSQRIASLVPTGREQLLELSYGRPYQLASGQALWLDAVLALRSQPGHQADAPGEAALMLRAQGRF